MPSKLPPYSPLGPLATSISALRTGTGVLLVDVGTHSQLAACTFKWFDPAKYFLTWYTLSDERSAPQLQSFLVGGRGLGSSMRSSTFIARVHYSCTSVYLITWTAYLRILRHVIMTSWLVVGSQVKAKRGIASAKKWTVAPWRNVN